MRDPRERLLDILEAIQRIEKYSARGLAAFKKDVLIQNWFVHHLQIIGEAAARLDRGFEKVVTIVKQAFKEVSGDRNTATDNREPAFDPQC
ncbi:MAG: hypothetical protein NTV79_07295 [Candidatus Aureabacteria bacterium]|nr:hypothetical protein [Candidatus Auribacterota bacterium]